MLDPVTEEMKLERLLLKHKQRGKTRKRQQNTWQFKQRSDQIWREKGKAKVEKKKTWKEEMRMN